MVNMSFIISIHLVEIS